MSAPWRAQLHDSQLLVVRTVAVHTASDELTRKVLRRGAQGPMLLAAATGSRALGGDLDTVGLVVGATALGTLAGLAEARIDAIGDVAAQARYIAAKDQAGGAARDTPTDAPYRTAPHPTERVGDQIAAQVEARRGSVAAMVQSIRDALAKADDDRDGVIQEACEVTYQEAQQNPHRLATATVAALLMLAERS